MREPGITFYRKKTTMTVMILTTTITRASQY